jgi:signal transduction histidine kinase
MTASRGTGNDHDDRVLVLAPTGKDAPLACEVLGRHGVTAAVCADLEILCTRLLDGAGALLVAEEALAGRGLETLVAALGRQPAWSDVPVLVILHGTVGAGVLDRLGVLRNTTLVERPIRIPALVSTVNMALRARMRQYEVRDLMRELADANRAKDDFVAMVSHELRSPLNVIRGMAQTLRHKGVEPDRVVKAARLIDRNADVLNRLVEDLLDLSRLQKKRFQLRVSAVSLAEVIDAALATVRTAAEAKHVGIATDLAPLGSPVLGDSVRLEQIVANLLTNAVKFTPAGGSVTLQLRSDRSTAVISVRDTGEGIDPELLPHIFEPFRQGRNGRHGGLGLGLAIVRQFVELHGGAISARSEGQGRGAEFTVRLPLHTVSTDIAV